MTTIVAIEDGALRIQCGDCGRSWTVPRERFFPGAVLRCPHCGGHFVPRLRDYLRLGASVGEEGIDVGSATR